MSSVLPNHTHELIAIASEPYLENKTKPSSMEPTKPAKLRKRKKPKYSDDLIRCAAFRHQTSHGNTRIYGDADVVAQGGMDYWVQGWVKIDIHEVYGYIDGIVNRLAQKGDMRTPTSMGSAGSTIFPILSVLPGITPTGVAPAFSGTVPQPWSMGGISVSSPAQNTTGTFQVPGPSPRPKPKPSTGLRKSK